MFYLSARASDPLEKMGGHTSGSNEMDSLTLTNDLKWSKLAESEIFIFEK
jgi:hypothetical protein